MGKKAIKILGISGSPRKNGNTEILVREALEGAAEVPWPVETELYSLAGKKIDPCTHCVECLRRRGPCVHMYKDDFHELWYRYMSSDAIIMGSPVYVATVSGQLKAAIDRLSHSMCSTFWDGGIPRLMKVGAAVAQGMNKFYQGQDFTLQLMINAFLLWNHIAVSGDLPLSYIGTHGSTDLSFDLDAIKKDEKAMKAARNLGRRVSETTKIIKIGLTALADKLPKEYKVAIEGYKEEPLSEPLKGKEALEYHGPKH